jgi:hypothetical protein
VELRLAVELVPADAALRARGPRLRVHVDAAHRREIDHHATIDGRRAGDVVAAAAHRDVEASASRASLTASATSAVPRQHATSAGRLSMSPLCTRSRRRSRYRPAEAVDPRTLQKDP